MEAILWPLNFPPDFRLKKKKKRFCSVHIAMPKIPKICRLGSEHSLLLYRTWVWLPAYILVSKQVPVNSGSRGI